MLSVSSSCVFRLLLLLVCCFGIYPSQAQHTEEELSSEKIAILNKAVRLNKEGFLLLERGEPEAAKAHFRKAIALDSSNIDFYYNLGNACRLTQDWPLAVEFYSKAIRVMPDEPDLYYYRGEVFNKQQEFRKAIEDFSTAIRLGGGENQMDLLYLYYFNRGVAYLKLQQYAEAGMDFSETLKLNESHYGAYANRGMASYMLKNTAAACQDWQRAYALGYEKVTTHLNNHCK